MKGKDKAILAIGIVIMAAAIILKLTATLTMVQFTVVLAIGFMVTMHPIDYKKRELNARDEFIRRVNQISMAKSWRATQYLVVALLFGTLLNWITLNTIWILIVISVFMLVTYIVFLASLFHKGEVE